MGKEKNLAGTGLFCRKPGVARILNYHGLSYRAPEKRSLQLFCRTQGAVKDQTSPPSARATVGEAEAFDWAFALVAVVLEEEAGTIKEAGMFGWTAGRKEGEEPRFAAFAELGKLKDAGEGDEFAAATREAATVFSAVAAGRGKMGASRTAAALVPRGASILVVTTAAAEKYMGFVVSVMVVVLVVVLMAVVDVTELVGSFGLVAGTSLGDT